jgi:ATP-binding cassette, sub-family E, member 1
MALRIRIAVSDDCKPSECLQQCKKVCPIERMDEQQCVDVNATSVKARFAEDLCINCGLCAKRCPKKAVTITVETPCERLPH